MWLRNAINPRQIQLGIAAEQSGKATMNSEQDPRVRKAVAVARRSSGLKVPELMILGGFSELEAKDRTLQMRLRRALAPPTSKPKKKKKISLSLWSPNDQINSRNVPPAKRKGH